MKNLIVLFSFCLFSLNMLAQRYDIVGGIKVADGIGLSGAYRFADKVTGELYLKPNLFSDYSMVSVMAKRHWSILGSRRFNVFAGGGLFTRNGELGDHNRVRATGIGLTMGAELTIGKINIAYDVMPLLTVNQNDLNKNYYSNSGVSIRYVFDKRDTKIRKGWQRFKDRFKKKQK